MVIPDEVGSGFNEAQDRVDIKRDSMRIGEYHRVEQEENTHEKAKI
jgi:hypothetical protein